jgi:hypothetical protein
MTDKKNFVEGMKLLKKANLVNGRNFNKDEMSVWFNMLDDITDSQFNKSIIHIIKTSKYFPSISEIREVALKTDILPAVDAWNEVLDQINRCCGSTGETPVYSSELIAKAVRSIGGLNSIWMAGTDRESYYRSSFIKAYESMQDHEHNQAMLGSPTKEESEKILDMVGLKIKEIGDN